MIESRTLRAAEEVISSLWSYQVGDFDPPRQLSVWIGELGFDLL